MVCHRAVVIYVAYDNIIFIIFFITMEINDFIQNFADQFDETEASVFTAETNFRDLDEWGSLIALSVMSMVDDEYDVQLTAEEMRATNTIQELYDVVKSHK